MVLTLLFSQVVLVERLDSEVGEPMLHLKVRRARVLSRRSDFVLTQIYSFLAGGLLPQAHSAEHHWAKEAPEVPQVRGIPHMCALQPEHALVRGLRGADATPAPLQSSRTCSATASSKTSPMGMMPSW